MMPHQAGSASRSQYDGRDGSLTGVARLPTENFAMVPLRPVEIADDGRVYVMVAEPKAVRVYMVRLGICLS